MPEPKVRINGKILSRRVKAPFLRSGRSIWGAIEIDEPNDQIKCHECGKWFDSVGNHIHIHGMSARDYKRKHGLRMKTSLLNEALRLAQARLGAQMANSQPDEFRQRMLHARQSMKPHSGTSRAEHRNEHGRCRAQVLHRIRSLAEKLGRTPTAAEIRAAGLAHNSLFRALSVPDLKSVMTLAGLMPRPQGKTTGPGCRPQIYSDQVLIESLLDFFGTHHRLPFRSDFPIYLLPSYTTYCLHFGSWQKALRAAGLSRFWKPKRYTPLPREHDPVTGHFTGVIIDHDQTSPSSRS